MDADRLKHLEDIYHAACDIAEDGRESFLDQSCGSDNDLRREVESLLSFDETPSGFMDKPPEALAAEMYLGRKVVPTLAGEQIGHYRIEKLLGEGGMGVVYLAQDTKLDRKVAIKFLNKEFSNHDSKLRRFVQEAKAASALNHPNILTVFEIGDSDDTRYIVTEWIDGLTLREYLDQTTRPRLSALLDIGAQVAEALGAAHNAGIIHRDIKPENIMVRKDGYAKILDFGLAKLAEMPGFIGSDANSGVTTRSGIIMGTVSYMSPEQARGKTVDARTDLWSLGIVIYEMLTGKLPFRGETMSDTVASILTGTPQLLDDIVSNVPGDLQAVLDRLLSKLVEDRYQTAWELRYDLMSVAGKRLTDSFNYPFTKETPNRTESNKSTWWTRSSTAIISRSRISAVWLIVPLLILGIGAGVYWRYFNVSHSAINRFQSTKLDILTAHGLARSVAISPDGKYIVYAKDEDGRQSLWIRQTASAGDTQIIPAGSTKFDYLKFSRDGNFLYFVGIDGLGQTSSLFQITTLGRNQRRIITGVDSQISFSPDGSKIAFIRVTEGDNSIVIADEQGGNERILKTRKFPEVYTEEVSWSPDGKLIAAPTLTRGATYAGGMAVVDVATGTETRIPLKEEKLLRISQLAWVSDGKGLIYMPYAADMGQRYQIRYASYPSGEVQNVTNDLSSYEDLSLTSDSQTIVAVQREYSMGIWLTSENDFSSSVGINSKTAADDGERGVSWTSDGKIVFVSSEGGAQNIWRMDVDGSNPKPLTTGYNMGKIFPALSVGGNAITFFSRDTDPVTKELLPGSTFFQMDSDGQNVTRVVPDHSVAFAAASSNAEWVVYTSRAGGILRIWKAPLKGGEAIKLTDVDSISPSISRDGRLLAYFINEKGKPLKLGLISIDGGVPIREIELPSTTNIEAGITWNKVGNGVLFVNTLGTTSNIWVQPVDGTRPKPLTAFKEFQIAAFALNPEGTRLAVARGSRNRDIVLIKDVGK